MKTEPSNFDQQQIEKLSQIAHTINKSEDVLSVLDHILAELVEFGKLQSGWIFLRKEGSANSALGNCFYLAAQCNLPGQIRPDVWHGSCACQDLGKGDQLGDACQLVDCDRFAEANRTWPELQHHTCIPLQSLAGLIGLLNIAAPDGATITPSVLSMLNLAAAHLGTALDRRHLADRAIEKYEREQAILLALTSQLLSLSTLEEVLDHLTSEVIRLLDVDACALLLPDEQSDYLVFRASAGWHSDPVAEKRRIPGSGQSISGRVMRQQVADLSSRSVERADISEMAIEWLDEEGFEEVIIVPLAVDSQSIGALIVSTRTPREFSQDEVRFLKILANQAGITIMDTRLHKEELRLKRLEEELAVGRRIQRSLLPIASPDVAGWQFSDVYRPARQVGGDLYDYFELPHGDKRLGFVIGDVVDKGVPAALFMATSRTLIRSTALAGLTAASTLIEANKLIQQDSPSELFLSAFLGILDTTSGKLDYANAGHNPPLWFQQATGETVALQAKGPVLCVLDEIILEERSVDVARGDILVFYTDGVTEAMNTSYEEFGWQRLQHVVATHSHKSATEILEAILEAVDDFAGTVEQNDDLTLVVAKRL
ncbi:MAG: SpoIIE family protein phosphatase [Chloroflexota bacterium]|jgi:sigma-B regulation protein RsbU (phosphoserine phosphatase)